MKFKVNDLVFHTRSKEEDIYPTLFKVFELKYSDWSRQWTATVQPVFKTWSVTFFEYYCDDLRLATEEEKAELIAGKMLE
jgi:hypothetical protein